MQLILHHALLPCSSAYHAPHTCKQHLFPAQKPLCPGLPRTQHSAQSPPLQPPPVCPTRSILLPLCHLNLSKVNIPLLSLLTIRDCLQFLSWDVGAARLALDLLQRTWLCTLFSMQSPRATSLLGDVHVHSHVKDRAPLLILLLCCPRPSSDPP